MSASDPESNPQPKRKRRTQAEIEAERQAQAQAAAAEAAKPIDPVVWIILGVLILFLTLWIVIDTESFASAGQPKDQGILQLIPLLLINAIGKTPTVILLTILGGVPLVWGIAGWLRKRFGKTGSE
jgi:hypothetical protein